MAGILVFVLVTAFITTALQVISKSPWIAATAGAPLSVVLTLLADSMIRGYMDKFALIGLLFGTIYMLPVSITTSVVCQALGIPKNKKVDASVCSACGYDVRSTFQPRCPECGAAIASIRK